MPEEKKQNDVEDIFSSTEKIHKESNIFKEMEPIELPEEEEISEVAETSLKIFGQNLFLSFIKDKKKIFIIGGIAIILIFFGIYAIIPKIKDVREERKILEKENLEKNIPSGITKQLTDIDSDKDGLSDKEEIQYNANPLKVDTDNDGLSDRDEVKTWKTNPLNPDTDGDKINDGDEVRKKLNPKGEGSLLEIINYKL